MNRQVDVKALVSHIVRGDGLDKCRICMGDTTEGQVYLGDTVMMDGERPVSLAELLEIITGIEITEESLCPNGVCAACTAHAIAAQEFRTLVADSLKIWSFAVKQLEVIPLNHTPTVKSLCAFIRSDNLNIQIAKDYTINEKTTPLNRLKSRMNRKKSDERKPRVHRAGPPCKCTDCGKEFISPYYLNVHFKNSGQKDACITCGAIVLRGKQMRDHLVKVHRETAFVCKECPAIFNNEIEAKKHEKKAHKTGFTCGDCGRTFPRNASFETHAQMHAVRTCRTCGVQFTNRACYREHRSKCEPDAKPDRDTVPRNRRSNIRDPAQFTCDYCKKTYTSRPQLKNHILWIHMDVRPHQCQWCGKRFYTPARLAEHSVVHTRERNFACDICGAKLVSKMAAVYHRRRHTGEKPYRCEDCGDCFISASRRSEHAKRKHGKGPRLHCTRCPSSFVRIHELRRHIEKAHSHVVPVYAFPKTEVSES
ncbi:gastrula zinc finger protein XlCGF26.1-like isoform X2 [Cydia fagiglandana]|uniref:gastrula zinc finger protein XlCGF26.1-like isoform X2 n=1 Tax=Cydia fagiglandana TaxID=1458189 RepID=UPI002FEE3256